MVGACSPDVQPFVQAGVLRVADEVVEEEPDVRGHVVAGRHGVRGDIKDEPFGYRSEQGFLAREIGIQPFLAGVGFGRDAVDACAREAALGELRLGRNKDPLSSRFTLSSERIRETVTTVTLSNQTVRRSFCTGNQLVRKHWKRAGPDNENGGEMTDFDYLVIGGGTSGCLLAERLSSDPRIRVLLLEAGQSDEPALMANPAAWPRGSAVDWADKTVPQDGSDGAVHAWPRGKVLGGSSGINGMIHLRAHRSSYDRWEALGAPGVGLPCAASVSAPKRDRTGA